MVYGRDSSSYMKFTIVAIIMWVGWLLVYFTMLVLIVLVAWHFITKFW